MSHLPDQRVWISRGYYYHLQHAHQIGRDGEKLEDYLAKNIPNQKSKTGNRKLKNKMTTKKKMTVKMITEF